MEVGTEHSQGSSEMLVPSQLGVIMADDSAFSGGSGDLPELDLGGNGGWWPPRPIVSLILGGFLALVVAVVVVALATGGDGDDASDTTVGEPADETAGAGDDSSDRAGEDTTAGALDPADEVASDEPASVIAGGGPEWLVAWQDGFLRFGFVFQPAPLPEFDGRFSDLFPPEVLETLDEEGATNIDEATAALEEAGLLDQVIEIIDANPEAAEFIFGVEPPPPLFEIAVSDDGLDWTPLEGVSIPGGDSISSVQSDGEHLVVAIQQYDENSTDGMDGGISTLSVAVTSDLRDWEIHEIAAEAGEGVPDLVRFDVGFGGLAIGADGWVAATNTYTFVDEYRLLPEEIREQAESGARWELTPEESGLRVDLYEGEYLIVYDESGEFAEEVRNDDCCELLETRVLPWEELGIGLAEWQQYAPGGLGVTAASVWAASWGQAPVEHELPDGYGTFGSLVGTDAGFLAVSWPQEGDHEEVLSVGNDLLFSADGRTWDLAGSPATGGIMYLDQLVAVEGGVLATGSGGDGQTVLLGDADGDNWRAVVIPGLPEDTWIWFNSGSGAASMIDATDYSVFEECHSVDAVVLELDVPDGFVFMEIWPEGTRLLVENHANDSFVDFFSDLRYPEEVPEFMVFDDDMAQLAFVDLETGEEVLRISAAELDAAYDEAVDRAEDQLSMCETVDDGPGPSADVWLIATIDGSDWLVEDIDEAGAEMDYPQQAAVNGNVVVARVGDRWSRYEIA